MIPWMGCTYYLPFLASGVVTVERCDPNVRSIFVNESRPRTVRASVQVLEHTSGLKGEQAFLRPGIAKSGSMLQCIWYTNGENQEQIGGMEKQSGPTERPRDQTN